MSSVLFKHCRTVLPRILNQCRIKRFFFVKISTVIYNVGFARILCENLRWSHTLYLLDLRHAEAWLYGWLTKNCSKPNILHRVSVTLDIAISTSQCQKFWSQSIIAEFITIWNPEIKKNVISFLNDDEMDVVT